MAPSIVGSGHGVALTPSPHPPSLRVVNPENPGSERFEGRFERLAELFDELAGLAPREREERLAGLEGEPALAAELRGLLAAHDDERPLAIEARLAESRAGGFTRGARLGAYELLEPIGRGGMGEVWLAEQEVGGTRRRVAVKRIRRGLESEELLRRFRVEGAALSRLSHRSIARLLDAGVDDEGVPYLVLEHVDGQPVTEACDARRLGLAARLALFEEICGAVASAHASLVLHRDLKPSNILMTASGEIRLLDFGIAKLLTPEGEGPGETATRGLLATPEYASPEQLAGAAATTATDVHALGALLFELLTGRRPFAEHEGSDLALARAVAELEAPPPSGAALAGTPEEQQARAAARGLDARALARAVRGDLDTLVATALRKEPTQRYPSVERLAEDVARFRAGRPLRARPASAAYRLRKFVARHRAAVAVGGVAALLVVVLLAQIVRQSAIAARERDVARTERDAARAVTDFVARLFATDPYASEAGERDHQTLGDFLVASEGKIRLELANEPALRTRLLTLLARLNANLGRLDPALALAREAVDQRRSAGVSSVELADSLNILATAQQERGDYDAAERAFREALALRRATLGDRHADTAESVNNLAVLLALRDREEDRPETERLEREGLALRRELFGPEHLETAQSLNNLGAFLLGRKAPGDVAAAEGLFREALAIRFKQLGEDHPAVATTRSNLAHVVQELGRLDEAETLFRAAIRGWTTSLGPAHPRVSAGFWGLAKVLEERGALAESLDALRASLAIDEQTLPAGHRYLVEGRARIAALEARLATADAGRRR